MDDVNDAELLALAGDDSSDEGNTPMPSTTDKTASPLPPTSTVQNHTKDASVSARNSTPTASVRASSEKRVKKPMRRAESEEEGEASSRSVSHDSLDSAPMSESDSESIPARDAGSNGPLFPIDGKFHSEKDKQEIMSLSEVQREEILAERAVQEERRKQDTQLRQLLADRAKAESKSSDKKRKATNLDESPRKSSRQKTTLGGRKVGETSGAIEAYKRQREEKGLRDQQRRREGASKKDRRARSSSERFSSADAEGESEVEWDDGKNKVDEYQSRYAQQADFHDVRRATLPRIALTDYCFHPGFADAVKDCYVRMAAKPKPNGGMGYELMLIKGICEKEGVDYAVEKSNGKKVVTNQHLLIATDGSVKEFHFNGISNSQITEAEVANYKNLMTDAGKTLPTKPFLRSKLDDINSVINHSFTDEELHEKLRRSGALQSRAAPLERISIINRRKVAVEREDEAEIAKCDTELAALNGPKLKYGTFLVEPKAAAPPTTSTPSQQERLHELNLINRKKNREEVRKAQLAERKAQRLAREAVQRGEALEDTFARVKTYAKTHHDVNDTLAPHRRNMYGSSREASRSVTPAAVNTPKKEEPQPDFPIAPKQLTPSGMPILGNRNMDDEIIASMDMGIDVEI
ncbi:RNA polymerase-associated protein rtf1 [Lecanora helva]